jgi:excisionase family DNA binding protein
LSRLITPDDLAARWSICRAEVYRLLRQGLPSVKIGRARRIPIDEAEAWLLDRQQAAS